MILNVTNTMGPPQSLLPARQWLGVRHLGPQRDQHSRFEWFSFQTSVIKAGVPSVSSFICATQGATVNPSSSSDAECAKMIRSALDAATICPWAHAMIFSKH